MQNIEMDEDEDAICNPKYIQDAFVFCPMMGSIQMESILAQGIFLSEKEMSQMEDRKFSLYNRSTNITFEEKDSIKSKLQAVEDVLNEMEINNNEEEFYVSINVTGIFSYEKDTPIDNWLLNSVESLVGSAISLPEDWVQVIEVNKHTKWPLFTSLAIDTIEK